MSDTTIATPGAAPQGGTPATGSAVPPEPTTSPQGDAAAPAWQQARERDGMTDARLASARATWIGAGLDPAAFDKEYSGTEVAPTAGVPEPRAQVSAPSVTLPTISAAEAHALADRLAANGMSDADVAAEMDKLGYVADDRSEAQIAWDQEHLLDTPRDPSQYTIDLHAMGLIGRPITEVAEAREGWANTWSAMQLDPLVANGLTEMMSQTSRQVTTLDEFGQKMWALQQDADLLRHCGNDPERVAQLKRDAGVAVQYAFEHAANQGQVAFVIEGMSEAGAFRNATVLRMLAAHGSNLREWQAGRPK